MPPNAAAVAVASIGVLVSTPLKTNICPLLVELAVVTDRLPDSAPVATRVEMRMDGDCVPVPDELNV